MQLDEFVRLIQRVTIGASGEDCTIDEILKRTGGTAIYVNRVKIFNHLKASNNSVSDEGKLAEYNKSIAQAMGADAQVHGDFFKNYQYQSNLLNELERFIIFCVNQSDPVAQQSYQLAGKTIHVETHNNNTLTVVYDNQIVSKSKERHKSKARHTFVIRSTFELEKRDDGYFIRSVHCALKEPGFISRNKYTLLATLVIGVLALILPHVILPLIPMVLSKWNLLGLSALLPSAVNWVVQFVRKKFGYPETKQFENEIAPALREQEIPEIWEETAKAYIDIVRQAQKINKEAPLAPVVDHGDHGASENIPVLSARRDSLRAYKNHRRSSSQSSASRKDSGSAGDLSVRKDSGSAGDLSVAWPSEDGHSSRPSSSSNLESVHSRSVQL